MRAGALPNAADLDAIGRVYGTVRFVLANLYLIGGVAILVTLALFYILWRVARSLFRRRA